MMLLLAALAALADFRDVVCTALSYCYLLSSLVLLLPGKRSIWNL